MTAIDRAIETLRSRITAAVDEFVPEVAADRAETEEPPLVEEIRRILAERDGDNVQPLPQRGPR